MSNSCDPMDYSPPGSSVHGILQARILEWVSISFSRGSSQPRNRAWVFCIAGRFFTNWAIREAVIQGKQTKEKKNHLWNLWELNWIYLQAGILEWVSISFSRGSSQPRDWSQVSCIAGRRFILWVTREAQSSQTRWQISLSYKGHRKECVT